MTFWVATGEGCYVIQSISMNRGWGNYVLVRRSLVYQLCWLLFIQTKISGRFSMSQEVIYKNIDSLKPLEKLIREASSAISDPNRLASDDNQINEALIAAGGVGVGGAIGFAALYLGGSVVGLSAAGITSGLAAAGTLIGGGMAVGIAVLAAPAVILGVGGYAVMANINKQKLKEKKEMLLQEIHRKHNAVISEIRKTANTQEERIDYLTRLNTLLQSAISDLESDIRAEGA